MTQTSAVTIELTADLAARLARMALSGVTREYPHKPEHVLNSAADARTPRALHPAFYGCYDWHSSVHSHWALARLLHLHPTLAEAAAIHAVFEAHFTASALDAELAYLHQPSRTSFERPYGWAWFFKLVIEVASLRDRHTAAAHWHARLAPIAEVFAARLIDHLPRQTYPIRAGVHTNTAFALGFAWDYAKAAARVEMEQSLAGIALRLYQHDRNAPVRYEPGGNDFLSPCLIEADLMARVLEPAAFAHWLTGFVPGLIDGSGLLTPAVVSDRGDPQGVHLDGLNLSRAWCLAAIAGRLPAADPRRGHLAAAAGGLLGAGLAHLASGDFLADHWLGSFAVYALTQRTTGTGEPA